MIFTPYSDETNVINMIRKYRNEDYALIRMTYTMIDKNNLDANGILRDLLFDNGLVDYEQLEHGGKYGVTYDALFVQHGKTDVIKLKFYRVSNNRGDRRFSIETIKRKMESGEINEGDLLYISIFKQTDGTPVIYIINLTHNIPTENDLLNAIGMDAITDLFYRIKPRLYEIIHGGFFDNSKGYGPIAPKDVGDTLESLLGINTNNRVDADYNGLIEVRTVNLVWRNPNTGKPEVAAYWHFDDLRQQLYAKHPSTLWVKAESREIDGMVQFKYNEIEFSRAPQFTTFLSLIKSGIITYDWRGYTTKEGRYIGKNHGNAWRIKPYAKSDLFGEIEVVEL